MSRVLIGNLPPGTTIRNIDDFCSPFGRLLYVDVKNQGNSTLACVEYDNIRNSLNLVRARHGYNFNGYTVQLKVMSDDSGSGPFEVRDDSRRKKSPAPPPPMWSKNNNTQANSRMFNNNSNNRTMQGASSNFDDNRGNNYLNNSNRGTGPSSMDTSNLDYNQACRIVYERFVNEGFNPQAAKERTLEFVTNMQGGNNQGFNNNNSDYFGQTQGMNANNSDYFGQSQGGMNSNNSDYFGQDQGMNMNSNNFGNNFDNFDDFNGNQNWSGGNNYSGNQESFPNNNWGNSNGPNNQQMPSAWGGGRGGGSGGGMSYPMQGNNLSRPRRDRDNMPTTAGWNSGANRVLSKGRVGGVVNEKTVPRGVKPPVNAVDRESYEKSVSIRKKIELKITRGLSTPRDLKNLQFHTQIMQDYERNMRQQNKVVKKDSPDEIQKLQRYKSALGIVQKYKKLNQAQLTPEDKKSFTKSKAIVDEYEKSIAATRMQKRAIGGPAGVGAGGRNSAAGAVAAAYERKKQQLIRESKKNYPYDFRLSGAAKKKMRSLVAAGVEMNEAKLIALHSSLVVKELVDLKNTIKKSTVANGGGDKSKQLVPVGGAKAKPGAAKPTKPTVATKAAKPVAAKPKPSGPAQPDDPAAGRLKDMTKKERDGMRSANRLVFRYETKNTEIEALTERDIVLLRMSLRRLQTYHEKYDTPLRKTKYDVLLSEKYDKKESSEQDKKTSVKSQTKGDDAQEEVVEDDGNDAEVAEGVVEDAAVEEGGNDEAAGDEAEVEEAGDEEAVEEEAEEEQVGEEEEQQEEEQ